MRRFWGATFAIFSLVSADALAEPTTTEKALARSLFEQGRSLAKEGKWAEACPKFEESERLDHGIGTLFNLADCQEHIGKTASAWAGFSEVADLAKRANQAERESIARQRANQLVSKLSKIKIHVAPPWPVGLEVKLDDKPIGATAFDVDVPVDPGHHKVTATAPQKKPLLKDVVIAAVPGTTPVDVPNLDDDETVKKDEAPPPRPLPPPKPRSGSTWHKPAAVGVGAIGLIGLGVGTFFGLQASKQWSDAEVLCPQNRCSDLGYDGWEDAKRSAMVSTIGFAAGAALLAGAVLLWVIAPSSPPPSRTGLR